MKKLTNKKGFTLIEMLVVIAIIAILVAIIIPTVTSATTKANAATDAANLRSAKAAITIKVLDGTWDTFAADNDGEGELAAALGVPANAKSGDGAFSASVTKGAGTGATVEVKYGTNGTIDHYAGIAGGTASSNTEGDNNKT